MRVVLDSNVLISALISSGAAPYAIYRAWRDKRPDDNYLLAMAKAGAADFLVTGDAGHLLVLRKLGRTRIVTPREFLKAIGASG